MNTSTTIIRRVRADEWQQLRDTRLDALLDPVAAVAFLETHEQAVAKPDEFWRDRTTRAATDPHVAQFVAQAEDGTWLGSMTGVVERSGGTGPWRATSSRSTRCTWSASTSGRGRAAPGWRST